MRLRSVTRKLRQNRVYFSSAANLSDGEDLQQKKIEPKLFFGPCRKDPRDEKPDKK